MNRMKLMVAAAAAVAAMTGAPVARLPHFTPLSQNFGWGGRRRGRRGWSSKNGRARDAGIPKAFRQYARRYHGTIT